MSVEKIFETEAHGRKILILKMPGSPWGPMGHLCGYAQISKSEWDSLEAEDGIDSDCRYWDPRIQGIQVHGGVTFTDKFDEREGIEGHWVGFDCAHGFDFDNNGMPNKNVIFVRAECESLAKQLGEIFS